MNKPAEKKAITVKLKCGAALCETYGWIEGFTYPVEQFPPVDGYADANGQNIYIWSALRNKAVFIPAGQYEIVEQEK